MNDAIAVASQLGRLDFISAMMAVLGLILALAGIYAFIDFRRIARERAEEVAEKAARETAERVTNLYLQKEIPVLMEEYAEFVRGMSDDGDPDAIAGAQDDEQ